MGIEGKTKSFLDIPFDQWENALQLSSTQKYRVRQIQEWVFQRRVKSFDEMTNLPAELRNSLSSRFSMRTLRIVDCEKSARDGTARLNFETFAGEKFSSVFLPSYKNGNNRFSLCLSTQVGCAWGCVFCASGRVPFQRNLLPSEIVEQYLLTEEVMGEKIGSLLFMGMGEPLANYENVRLALSSLRSPLGFNIGARHITLSTCGLVPQIRRLAEEGPKVNLAISLHAADDETRRKILPKSSRWPIKDLLRAAWYFQEHMGQVRLTFEYILLKGINDGTQSAKRLGNQLRRKKAWVNLIAYNPVPGLPYQQSSESDTSRFEQILTDRGVFVRVRKPQGTDIAAGCGQLGESLRFSRKSTVARSV